MAFVERLLVQMNGGGVAGTKGVRTGLVSYRME